jgi:hypothetical protein
MDTQLPQNYCLNQQDLYKYSVGFHEFITVLGKKKPGESNKHLPR